METNLTIYDCQELIREIERAAEKNGGEITDEQLAVLVQAQTTSLARLGGLCGFLKFVEHRIELCKTEEQRIAQMRRTAERRLESIEKFLLPFVSAYRAEKNHPLDIGTFSLSTRKSTAVEIDEQRFFMDENNRKKWSVEKVSYSPDKKAIKVALEAGHEIEGASLVEREHLTLK